MIVTAGAVQPRLKPGVAIAVLRDGLAALSALHREGIVHGDVKPSNIMLKRTGNAKLIDIGSAFQWGEGARGRTCTPAYAAPEVLEGAGGSPQVRPGQSRLRPRRDALRRAAVRRDCPRPTTLLQAKRTIPDRLAETLPEDVVCNDLLMSLIGGLIATDPADRFPERRGCRPRRAGRRQLPPPARPRQPRQRVRQRDPRLARGARLTGVGLAWNNPGAISRRSTEEDLHVRSRRDPVGIREFGLDGWLLYDFRGSNLLARRVLGLEAKPAGTRRFLYAIPAHGRREAGAPD